MGREAQEQKSIARLKRVGAERGLELISELALVDSKIVFYQCKRQHKVKVKRSSTRSPHWAGQCANCVYEERLRELQRIAAERGGRIASKEKELRTRDWVEIECENGHKTRKRVYAVLEGTWCAECYFESMRSRIEDARKYAIENGGRCLSSTCGDGSARLKWECGEGHQWHSSLKDEHSRKTFCPECKIRKLDRRVAAPKRRSKEIMLQRAHKIAESHGGKCLSSTFTTTSEKLNWECSEGHRWLAPTQSILYNGAWCNVCAMRKRPGAITLDKLRKYASERGGQLVSEEYLRNDIKLGWRCEEGHEFERTWTVMQRSKYFCPYCRK